MHVEYTDSLKISLSLTGFGVGKVLRSENPKFEVGDYVYGFLGEAWAFFCSIIPHIPLMEDILSEHKYYSVQDGAGLVVIDNKYELPLSAYLGVLGMPGEDSVSTS